MGEALETSGFGSDVFQSYNHGTKEWCGQWQGNPCLRANYAHFG